MPESSIFLAGDLEERIESARNAYNIMDEHRYEGTYNHLYGYSGGQFCSFLGEYIGEMTDPQYDYEQKMEIADRMYEQAWEYYPEFAHYLENEE